MPSPTRTSAGRVKWKARVLPRAAAVASRRVRNDMLLRGDQAALGVVWTASGVWGVMAAVVAAMLVEQGEKPENVPVARRMCHPCGQPESTQCTEYGYTITAQTKHRHILSWDIVTAKNNAGCGAADAASGQIQLHFDTPYGAHARDFMRAPLSLLRSAARSPFLSPSLLCVLRTPYSVSYLCQRSAGPAQLPMPPYGKHSSSVSHRTPRPLGRASPVGRAPRVPPRAPDDDEPLPWPAAPLVGGGPAARDALASAASAGSWKTSAGSRRRTCRWSWGSSSRRLCQPAETASAAAAPKSTYMNVVSPSASPAGFSGSPEPPPATSTPSAEQSKPTPGAAAPHLAAHRLPAPPSRTTRPRGPRGSRRRRRSYSGRTGSWRSSR